MTTLSKDFRIKSGLAVEGNNATVNGSDIFTAASLTNGSQNNISVTYDPNTKGLSFSVTAIAIDTAGPLTYENEILDVATGNGLTVDGTDALALSIDELAGLGFDSGTGQLQVNKGSSIVFDNVTGAVDVNLASVVDNGYFPVVQDSAGALQVEMQQGAGQGPITVDSYGTIDLLLGTNPGLDIDVTNSGLQLPDVAANTGTFGDSSTIPVISVDGKGRVTAVGTETVATALTIEADADTQDTVSLLTDKLVIAGGEGIDTTLSDNTITVSAELATDTNLGIASFNANNFTVTAGAVEANDITIGNTAVTLGETVTTLSGLANVYASNVWTAYAQIQELDVPNTLTVTSTGIDITQDVDLNSYKITNLAEPTSAQDAATKAYVDATAEGLHIKPAVLAATTGPLTATYDNGTSGIDATLTIAATATLDVDGQTSWEVGDGVLVKDQTDAFENGRYFVVTVGDAETDWVLKRCIACDEADEIPSSYVFVQAGSTYSATGWVALVENPATFAVGTDDITWTQFSGAGTYIAGSGINLNGNEFSVETDPNETDALVTHTQLDGFLNSTDGTTYLALTEYTDLAIETGDATATPTYLAIDYASVATQVAATVTSTGSGQDTAYSFATTDFRTAKFLVKIAYGSHTQVSEVLLTLDASDNVAITEYAMVGTNGSLGDISATVFNGNVELVVGSASTGAEISVAGTLIA
jgi:hypothetical protein